MKRLLVAASLASVAVQLSATTFGQPDGNRHPYVGTIILQTATGYYSCSATLMSPTVLLTAGHCTEEAGVANLQTRAKFSSSITGNAIPHPEYDDFNQFPATYDVGVPTDINNHGYLDTALNEVYYNDTFGNRRTDRAGNPWAVDQPLPAVETVALHENGHSFGLGHFGPPPTAVINPVYGGILQTPLFADSAGMTAIWGSWPR